jgi:hypothetical protein
MLQVDLTDSLNWNRLGAWRLQAEIRESGAFAPILPVSAIAPSRLILAAGFNDEAPAHWQLAAWCTASVSVNPGSTAQGIGLAFLPRQSVRLNGYSLILLPEFAGVTNYAYVFNPVRWLPSMTLEAWWYDGVIEEFFSLRGN